MAFCRWLSARRGQDIRLPKAAEWKQATTPSKGEYPWGVDEPTEELANFETIVGRPTPAGIFPLGNGPHGHSDLAGNVWEWCADLEVPEAKDKEDAELWRYLRGGSWDLSALYLRSAYRLWIRASFRYIYVGFRVCAVPPTR